MKEIPYLNNKSKDSTENLSIKDNINELENNGFESDYNKTKIELKSLFIEQIFFQIHSAPNYEIPENLFNIMTIEPYGNWFYMYISYFLYNNPNQHNSVREYVFELIEKNKELFYIFFNGNDNADLNNYSPEELLTNYIELHKVEGSFAGELEYTSICKLYQLRIIFGKRLYRIQYILI